MAIFNSYVSLPEGITHLHLHHQQQRNHHQRINVTIDAEYVPCCFFGWDFFGPLPSAALAELPPDPIGYNSHVFWFDTF